MNINPEKKDIGREVFGVKHSLKIRAKIHTLFSKVFTVLVVYNDNETDFINYDYGDNPLSFIEKDKIKIHKVRSKKDGITWCEDTVNPGDKIASQWVKCNCRKCFLSAIHGQYKSGGRVSGSILDTARRWMGIKEDRGELR